MTGNLDRKLRLPRIHFRVLLHVANMRQGNKRLYFPSEGRRTEDFFALKNPTASAGLERANLATKGQHAKSRPPKPLNVEVRLWCCVVASVVFSPSRFKQSSKDVLIVLLTLEEDDTFLPYVGKQSPFTTASQSRRLECSTTPLWEPKMSHLCYSGS